MNNYTTTSTNDYLHESFRIKLTEELRIELDKVLDKYSPKYTLDSTITFEQFCQKHIKVWDKCKSEYKNFELLHNQHKTYNHIENNKFSIINQYRQGGMSSLFSTYSIYKAITIPNISISYYGFSKGHIIDVFKDKISDELIYLIKNNSNDRIEFNNDSKIIFKSFNSNVIGEGSDIIILDNYAYVNDRIDLKTIYSPLKNSAKLIISSSPKKDSEFNKLCVDAFENKNNFKYLKLDWFDDERFNQNLKIDINGVKNNDWSTKIKDCYGTIDFNENVLGLVL
jgi:hypothetical protein